MQRAQSPLVLTISAMLQQGLNGLESSRHVTKQRKLSMERDALVTHIRSLFGLRELEEYVETPFGMVNDDGWSV
jgi:hypothetical protein